MDKMKIKRIQRIIQKDLNYYMKEYNLTQKEAYEIIYEQYYLCMRLSQSYIEIDKREEIHNILKGANNETKN